MAAEGRDASSETQGHENALRPLMDNLPLVNPLPADPANPCRYLAFDIKHFV